MEYTIGEFSEITGLSVHTLRYYEKEGIIVPSRKVNGRRCYTDQNITWMSLIRRLKDTRMPIKEIRAYAKLRAEGDGTLHARLEMLLQHRSALLGTITALEEHLSKLDEKIDHYREALSNTPVRQK